MSKSGKTYSGYKAIIFGMGWGLVLSFVMGYLLEDLAMGLVFGLGIGAGLTYDRLKKQK